MCNNSRIDSSETRKSRKTHIHVDEAGFAHIFIVDGKSTIVSLLGNAIEQRFAETSAVVGIGPILHHCYRLTDVVELSHSDTLGRQC